MHKQMIAFALVASLGVTANAADWFNGGIEQGWPEKSVGGTWQNVAAGTFDGTAVAVDTDTDNPLQFAATESKQLGTDAKTVTVTSKITFTPFASASELPTLPAAAKAGVVQVKVDSTTNYFVVAKKADADANEWRNTGIVAAGPEADISISVDKDYQAVYDFGEETYTTTVYMTEAISTANYAGLGKVASLSAVFDPNATPVIPGGDSHKSTAQTEEAAKAEVTIGIDQYAQQDLANSGVSEDTYKGYFTKKVTGQPGDYTVTVELSTETTNDVQKVVDSKVRAIDMGGDSKVTVGIEAKDVKPGLYYGIAVDGKLPDVTGKDPAEWKMATDQGVSLEADKPNGASGFFILKCSPVDTNKKN